MNSRSQDSAPSISSPSDEELFERAAAGEEWAFVELYERHRAWAHSLARRFTGNSQEAADVVQEAFLWLLRGMGRLELRVSFRSLLFPALRNLSVRVREKAGRFSTEEEALEAAAARSGPDATVGEDLRRVLLALPGTQREVCLLRFLDGFSLEEVAGALEVPLGTVKSRLHSALTALREDPGTRKYFLED